MCASKAKQQGRQLWKPQHKEQHYSNDDPSVQLCEMSGCHVVTIADVSLIDLSRNDFVKLLARIWDAEARQRILRYHKGCATAAEFHAHNHVDTKCFLIGRILLQLNALGHLTVGRYPRPAWRGNVLELPAITSYGDDDVHFCQSVFRKTEAGKPHFDNDLGWSANVSHAGRVVGCSSAVGVLNGFDVMPVELVPMPKHLALAAGTDDPSEIARTFWQGALTITDLEEFYSYFVTYFTAREWVWIRSSLSVADGSRCGCFESLHRFFRNWTLKESYIKAIGIGLGLELSRAEFRILSDEIAAVADDGNLEPSHVDFFLDGELQRQWTFYCFDLPATNTVAALALGPLGEAVSPLFPTVLAPAKLIDGVISMPVRVQILSDDALRRILH